MIIIVLDLNDLSLSLLFRIWFAISVCRTNAKEMFPQHCSEYPHLCPTLSLCVSLSALCSVSLCLTLPLSVCVSLSAFLSVSLHCLNLFHSLVLVREKFDADVSSASEMENPDFSFPSYNNYP